MGVALLPLALAGTAIAGAGQIVGAIAASNQASYEADVALQNQTEAIRTGKLQLVRDRRDARRKLASMRAAYGASGVQVGMGTPLEVLGDAAMEAEENAMLAYRERVLQARGFGMQASAASSRSSAALIGGGMSAGGTLLTGGTAIYDRFGTLNPFGASA